MGMGEKNVRMAFPKPDAVPGDWVLLGGVARAFEATVEARVLDDSGNEYVRSFTTATDAGPNWGFWAMMLPAPDGSHITLEAFTTSAKDGSVQDLISRQLFR